MQNWLKNGQIIPYPHNRKPSLFLRERRKGYEPNLRLSSPRPFAVAGKCCVPVTLWIQIEFKKKPSDYSYEVYMSGKCHHPSLENLSRRRGLLGPLCVCYLSHQCLEFLPSNTLARFLVCCFLNKKISLGSRYPFTILC